LFLHCTSRLCQSMSALRRVSTEWPKRLAKGPAVQGGEEARAAGLPQFYGHPRSPVRVRTAYRCRAYPDDAQQAMLNRTFGCVRLVWNCTLATRHKRYVAEGQGASYAETDRALTVMKKAPE
jgi:helix-turn-helix protein